MPTLDQLSLDDTRHRLRGQDGLRLQMGPFVVEIRTRLSDVAGSVAALYAGYPMVDDDTLVDFQVSVRKPAGLRQWTNPQVTFGFDGQEPFNPLPGDQGFPLLEWGLNWCVYANCHQYLILHAAVLERGGRALILPAPSGSGKSTLCAGLLFSGWRLLSDELALICPDTGNLVPHPRPVSLKNDSIDVIRRFAPQVRFGSRVEETVKGVVAHFAAPPDAILKSNEQAMPAWVVLPKYSAGCPATLQALDKAQGFMQLVQNAFNYEVFGLEGFRLLGSLMDRCACFTFEYSRVPEAVDMFARLADGNPAACGR
jgi:HprK-related kinase A